MKQLSCVRGSTIPLAVFVLGFSTLGITTCLEPLKRQRAEPAQKGKLQVQTATIRNEQAFLAVRSGDIEALSSFLREGGDVNAETEGWPPGGTLLHAAAVEGYKPVVELLLAHQAEVNAKNQLGYTPLHLAVAAGCPGKGAATFPTLHSKKSDSAAGV